MENARSGINILIIKLKSSKMYSSLNYLIVQVAIL